MTLRTIKVIIKKSKILLNESWIVQTSKMRKSRLFNFGSMIHKPS
ncbi:MULTISPECIES: hypothetical protein [unclassified Limnospira]